MKIMFPAAVAAFAALALGAHAQTPAPAPAAASDAPAPVCTDRPTKANSTCSVPAGHWQIETDIVNFATTTVGGVRTTTTYATNPYLKYGVTDRIDLEGNFAPYIETRVKGGGSDSRVTGNGDLYLRLKDRILTGDALSLSLIPFVKAPVAARGLGNGRWEGGLAAPISVALPEKFSLTFGPELDALANASGQGTHVGVVNLINLSRPVTGKLTLAVEVWNSTTFDPAVTLHQYSADIAAIYLLTPVVQLDAGANFGLNKQTPDAQLYVGVSTRF